MRKAACILLGLLLAAVPVAAQTEAHLYSPETNLERSELAQLETAKRSVDVAIYSFTDRELAAVLTGLARRGVRVRVYRDREQFQQETQRGGTSTTGILLARGVEVRVKGARDLMHLKSYAIDGRLLRTGSANWSPTGLKRQDNDVLYESSPEGVKGFERKFEEMWAQGTDAKAPGPMDR
jgi:phosphatidylserine/phosphatidylglycerophosphate/cardiolipin synthase-like enzyme